MASQLQANDAIETDAKPMTKSSSTTSSSFPSSISDLEGNNFFDSNFKNIEKLFERKHLRTSDIEYPRPGSEPGFILIFNQEKFINGGDRPGSRRDVNEILTAFQRLGYNIGGENIVINGTTEQIQNKLKEVSEMDLSEHNCLIIFFLSHGREGDELLTFDSSISTYDVWKNFINCKHLENKPKMFVFQACKGDGFSTTSMTAISREPTKVVPENTFNQTHLGPDMLVVYSTIEGNVSYRSSLTGSWFIQELCRNSSSYGRRDDVVSVVIRTTKCLSYNYYHPEIGISKKQMPVFMSTLSKKFYLNSNKDRASALLYKDYYDEVMNKVNHIKEQVDKLPASIKRKDLNYVFEH